MISSDRKTFNHETKIEIKTQNQSYINYVDYMTFLNYTEMAIVENQNLRTPSFKTVQKVDKFT